MSKGLNLRIGARLGLAFGLMVLLMVLMAGASHGGLTAVDSRVHQVIGDRYFKVRTLNRIFDELNQQSRNARNVLLLDTAAERVTEIDATAPRASARGSSSTSWSPPFMTARPRRC